jgi:hypothetical protein
MTTVMKFAAVRIEDRYLPYVASIEGDGPVLISMDFLSQADDTFIRWEHGDLMIGGYRLRWIEVRPGNIVAFELVSRKLVIQ